MKKQVNTSSAPAAIGPYSQGVIAGNLLFVSGQIPINPADGSLVSDSLESQANQVFENLRAIIQEAGTSFEHVLKLTIYLTDLENFAAVNKVMENYFSQPYPARATVEVSRLPKDVEVEIDAIVELA
ncbi:MAG: RidA family protein [Proteobacteria bacterium]|nr:RidA family protein [Pseudomonadota bacterium]